MARKGNTGFGSPKSLSFKGVRPTNNKINKIEPVKAAGTYPSDRRYGTSIHRTVIERYDAESDWIRWRKGYEYYARSLLSRIKQFNEVTQEYQLSELTTTLYVGTNFEIDVTFYGWKFSGQNADDGQRFVMKRVAKLYDGTDPELFFVTDPLINNAEAKSNEEFWVQGNLGKDYQILGRSIGERLTDGKTEATLTNFLNSDKEPGIYMGKTFPDKLTDIKVLIRASDLKDLPWLDERGGDIRAFIGEIGLLPRLYNDRYLSDVGKAEFTDEPYYFKVDIEDTIEGTGGFSDQDYFRILDNSSNLPPSLYDVAVLEPIFATNLYEATIKGEYQFQKSDYQRFFGENYLTAQLVESKITRIAYPTLPFVIKDVRYTNAGYNVEFTAEPFLSVLDMYAVTGDDTGYLVLADYSFTETMLDTVNGEYSHSVNGPYSNVKQQIEANNEFSKLVWYKKVNDIDPYVGYISDLGTLKPVFNQPTQALRLADIYSCSCPSYSQAQLTMPQTTQGPDQRKVNRQLNYPLPTALGKKDYESIGLDSAAGRINSWQTNRAAASFKVCKHTIASMFDEHLKLQEPNTYQTLDAREEFGRKLAQDIMNKPIQRQESYARGGISTLEIVFALAQGLGYDDIETAYLVLNAKDGI